jgi:hypothetical protein
VRAAVCYNEKSWGPFYVRHGAALAYVHALSEDAGIDLPAWFVQGLASSTSRFQSDHDAGHFGKLHQAKGGVRNLSGFFAAFAIDGNMESKDIDYNIYQAGLCISFATRGGSAKSTAAFQAVVALLTGATKGNAEKAMTDLQKQLAQDEAAMGTWLQQLVAKGPR